MQTKTQTSLEKPPMYLAAYSGSLAFVIIAVTAVGWGYFNEVCNAILKNKFMFLAFLGGTFLSTCMIAVRTFKAQEKTSHITMMGIVLLPLAYFTFYFGVPKVIVVGICLVGIPIEVLSAQEMLRKRTSSHCLT